jgi:hypothetical protein
MRGPCGKCCFGGSGNACHPPPPAHPRPPWFALLWGPSLTKEVRTEDVPLTDTKQFVGVMAVRNEAVEQEVRWAAPPRAPLSAPRAWRSGLRVRVCVGNLCLLLPVPAHVAPGCLHAGVYSPRCLHAGGFSAACTASWFRWCVRVVQLADLKAAGFLGAFERKQYMSMEYLVQVFPTMSKVRV